MSLAALYGIYGASGHGRETMPWARRAIAATSQAAVELVFVDDAPGAPEINGHRVLTYDEFRGTRADRHVINLAIGDGTVRRHLAGRCGADGIGVFSVVAENAVVLDDVTIGEGCILSAFALVTSNIKIGRHFHANMHASVAHDCRIGDFVTIGPGARCNGNVHIEDGAYVGSGAIIKHGAPGRPLVIGAGAVVGMGAVVTRSVPAGITVVGNPARPLTRDQPIDA